MAEPVETLPGKPGSEGEAATKKSDEDELFGDDNEETKEDKPPNDPFGEDTSEDSKEPQEKKEEPDEDPFG